RPAPRRGSRSQSAFAPTASAPQPSRFTAISSCLFPTFARVLIGVVRHLSMIFLLTKHTVSRPTFLTTTDAGCLHRRPLGEPIRLRPSCAQAGFGLPEIRLIPKRFLVLTSL